MASQDIVILSGGDLRHRYFIESIHHQFPVAKVLIDSFDYPEPAANNAEEQDAWNWFFQRRNEYEASQFQVANFANDPGSYEVIELTQGGINSEYCLREIQKCSPGFIAVFGTGLIKAELLEHFGDRLFNMHPGVSSAYRGSSCNFWPIYERNLEGLGATIIKINQGIDTGEIFAQETIELSPHDTEQTLIGKTLILGTELMLNVIRAWRQGTLNPLPLERNGRLFQTHQFSPAAVLEVRKMVESGELQSLLPS